MNDIYKQITIILLYVNIFSNIGIRQIQGQIGVSTTSGIKYLDIPVFYSYSIVNWESNINSIKSEYGQFSNTYKASDIPFLVEIIKGDPSQDVDINFSLEVIKNIGVSLRKELFLFVHRAEMIIQSRL